MRRNCWAMMALIVPLLLSTLVVKVGGAAGAPRQEFGNTCEFREGPRRGQRQRYPDQPALPVGTPCWLEVSFEP
jgi:hypothetical protein